ncbi:MAG: I78 family peptidase inhibitor [Pseudomonadota bacterium]
MRARMTFLAALAIAALAACASGSDTEAANESDAATQAGAVASSDMTTDGGDVTQSPKGFDDPDACGASRYESLIGTNIAAVTLPEGRKVRVLKPGAIATMDYSPNRLNIHVDEDGVITRVRCG